MAENKSSNGNVITDAVIDDLNRLIQDIRSKYPHPLTYDVIRLHPDLERCRASLIDEYFSVVAEIEKGKKPSRKVRQDYLKKLLSPLRRLSRIHPSGENPYLELDGTYPFIEEKIWIDKEIDIKKCHYDKKKYSIDFEYSKPLDYFDPDAKNIIIWNEYNEYIAKKKKKDAKRKAMKLTEVFTLTSAPAPIAPLDAGKTSVEELYKKWLPELTQERIKSKDLLDQILVCYTIKRALNGDQKAIDKLYSLYEVAATRIAKKMAEKRYLNESEIDEIKQEAKMTLDLLISGLKPEYIIDSFLMEDSSHSKTPLEVEIFFFWYFTDHVPGEIDRIMKRQPYRLDGLEIDYLLNPIAIIDAYTFWKDTPKRIKKFNSFSFRPKKETNLTTWLFGINKLPVKGVTSGFMQGRLCQHIDEILAEYYQARLVKKTLKKYNIARIKKEWEKWKNVPKLSIALDNESIEDARNRLTKRGLSARNIEIVIQKLKGISNSEIAKTNNLSKRHIMRIYKKAKSPKTTD